MENEVKEENYFEDDKESLEKTNKMCKILVIVLNILFFIVLLLSRIITTCSCGEPIVDLFIPHLIFLISTIFNYVIIFPFLLSKKNKNYDIKLSIIILYAAIVMVIYIFAFLSSPKIPHEGL